MNKFDNNMSIFEKTMNACLESKRVASNKKTVAKKNSKLVKESVKKTRLMKEELEDDELAPEPDMIPAEDEMDDDIMSDTVDDIVVVVDPELNADDADELAADMQDIVDNTPDDEVPTYDEYAGDLTYTCPICGNTFFSADEMNDGDVCPVCGETPTAFVLVGAVEAPDEVLDEPETDDTPVDDVPVDEPDETPDEDLVPADPIEDEPEDEDVVESYIYTLDEKTFNPFLTKFIRENYKNAKSFRIVSAKRSGKTLSLECKIAFKSGSTKNVTLRTENFVPKAGKSTIAFRDNGVFKNESKRVAPFVFETVLKGKTISCTGMKYSFTTVAEGKRYQISGNLIRESKRSTRKPNFQRGRRA